MVPLDDTHTVLDWIAAVDAPVLLVTGSYLGSLSHTLTALGMLLSPRPASRRHHRRRIGGAARQLEEDGAVIRRFSDAVPVMPLLALRVIPTHLIVAADRDSF